MEKNLVSWEDKLAALAKQQSERERDGLSTPYISTKGGQFTFCGEQLGDGKQLDVVIVDEVYDNAWYKNPYKANQFQSPSCYALNRDRGALAPHELAPEPQAEQCSLCEKNKFGSGPNRTGKACRNYRRLLVLSADDIAPDISPDKVALLNISPTSMGNFAKYAYFLSSKEHKPTLQYITRIHLKTKEGNEYSTFHFEPLELIMEGDHLSGLLNLKELAKDLLMMPYPSESPSLEGAEF